MSQNIILNKSHIVNLGNGNNHLRYELPRSITFGEEDTVALSNLNIYFSWFNITAKNNNNFFQYKWFNNVNGDVDTIHDITIPDGFYSIATLNEYILSVMASRGHMLETIDGSTYFIYFFELRTNSTYYSTSIKLSSLSDQYDFNDGQGLRPITDVVKTPSTWVLPATFQAPEIIIPSNNNFGSLLGFSGTISMDTSSDTTNRSETFLNTTVPNMMPSSSYILTCNLVSNEMSIPDNVFFSFTIPTNVGFGDVISPNLDLVHSKIKVGVYNHIEVRIYDQNFVPLQVRDPEMLLNLAIYKK